jgi:hypothetical protein
MSIDRYCNAFHMDRITRRQTAQYRRNPQTSHPNVLFMTRTKQEPMHTEGSRADRVRCRGDRAPTHPALPESMAAANRVLLVFLEASYSLEGCGTIIRRHDTVHGCTMLGQQRPAVGVMIVIEMEQS